MPKMQKRREAGGVEVDADEVVRAVASDWNSTPERRRSPRPRSPDPTLGKALLSRGTGPSALVKRTTWASW